MIKSKFYCDFCGKEVATNSINPDHMAYCYDTTIGFTNNLYANIESKIIKKIQTIRNKKCLNIQTTSKH